MNVSDSACTVLGWTLYSLSDRPELGTSCWFAGDVRCPCQRASAYWSGLDGDVREYFSQSWVWKDQSPRAEDEWPHFCSKPTNHPLLFLFFFFFSFTDYGTSRSNQYKSCSVSPFRLLFISPIPMSYLASSPPMRRCYNRIASTLITVFGAITNAAVTIQVLAAWRTFKWEPESEWESSGDKWQLNGVKFIWALLFLYFSSAASVCTIGLIGILKVRSQLFSPRFF